jgi:alkylation response protein AidB-like acyl-CoA dehydrogenase
MADPTTAAEAPEDLESYRQRLRSWLAGNMPPLRPDVRYDPINDDDDRASRNRELQRLLFDGGFAGICYPREYGGQGLSIEYQRVFDQESGGYELPVIGSNPTMSICGPTVLDFGTEEQKQRYIPAFLRGDELWVQFMSEPSGGSDMAGALTRATRDGDVFLMNGSKIWSTYAYRSDMALCLARTDWDVPKHRGLTMFMVPIHQPGITIQQIKMVDGNLEFCQEHFDDVALSAEHVLGEVNDGWTVASRLLYHERAAVGGFSPYLSVAHRMGRSQESGGSNRLVDLARARGRAHDPVARRLVGQDEVLSVVNRQLVDRVGIGIGTGHFPNPAGSLARLSSGLASATHATIALELAGDDAVAWEDDSQSGHVGIGYLRRQAGCIGGGTTEMARNIISERVLGMPREWSADRDVPFSQVPRGRAGAERPSSA